MRKYLVESKDDAGEVTDVTNGDLYESFGENPNGNILWISLILNSDGVRPRHANAGSLWPCIAVIAELRPKIPYAFQNSIMLAMWLGVRKPSWSILLEVNSHQYERFPLMTR